MRTESHGLERLFLPQNDNERHSVCWSRSDPAAVDERTTARVPWLHEILALEVEIEEGPELRFLCLSALRVEMIGYHFPGG